MDTREREDFASYLKVMASFIGLGQSSGIASMVPSQQIHTRKAKKLLRIVAFLV